MAAAALAKTPLSEAEQQEYLADTMAFDALVAKKVKSQVEWADYVAMYNPMDLDQAAACARPFDLKKVLTDLFLYAVIHTDNKDQSKYVKAIKKTYCDQFMSDRDTIKTYEAEAVRPM